MKYVEKIVENVDDDPLLELAGIFEYDKTDIGKNHDYYIGNHLRNVNE